MKFDYCKMNSQGNDFIIIDISKNSFDFDKESIKKICTTKKFIFDQLLLINTSAVPAVDCKIFNNDTSEAKQCGNGLRAIMLYLSIKFKINECSIVIDKNKYNVSCINKEDIKVNMGIPKFILYDLDFASEDINITTKQNYFIVKEKTIEFKFMVLDMGNLHCVIFSENSYSNKDMICELIDKIFKGDANISFVLNTEKFNETSMELNIKVREKGAGWTKSCGSGATAAAAAMIKFCYPEKNNTFDVIVKQEEAKLKVLWNPRLSQDRQHLPIFLYGPSELEYEAKWND